MLLKTSLLVIALLGFIQLTSAAGTWRTAAWTYFTSYPACCKNSPNYDPRADKTECRDYSGCKYLGDFAAIGHKSFDWVKGNNIVAFYDDSDPSGRNFRSRYGGKQIRIRKNGKEIVAQIADTCGNQDCNNCCHNNSRGGFLLDMEYWTVMRNFGNTDSVGGTIEFQIA